MNSTVRLAAVTARVIKGEQVDVAEIEWAAIYAERVMAAWQPKPDRAKQGRLLDEYAVTLPDRSPYAKATRIHREWSSYAANTWPRQRTLNEAPQGRQHSTYWPMMKAFDRVPCWKTIWRRLKKLDKPPSDAGFV